MVEDLFPSRKPYAFGKLQVGQGHTLYFEECGNPEGYPIVFLHGGPGAGCDENDRRFFDPEKWRILLFDQRGSGRSTPFCGLEANTTRHLVSDIKKILDFRKIKKAVVFGGSWGSTLALAYAIRHPETVSGMVLRGIYLATRADNDYYLKISASQHPELWERFINIVPFRHRKDPVAYYARQMASSDAGKRRKYAYEWAHFEIGMLHLKPPTESELDKEIKSFSFESMGVFEAHYLANGCFMSEGYILRNIRRISDRIPISIIHGRYDTICAPRAAWQLHGALKRAGKHAELHMVVAGHSSSDPQIRKKLVSETDAMYAKLNEA
ncbi:MAG: prolyl aminopeptidase [bacterium]|nr:prolyl aminopeptidase [bacterium]